MVVKGTTSAQITTIPAMETASEIISYSIVNKTAGALMVAAGAINGSTLVEFYSASLGANSSFQYIGEKIILEKGWSIYVYTSGASIDYYFSIL